MKSKIKQIGAVVIGVLVVAVALVVAINDKGKMTIEALGSLFTGLALFAIVATYISEREESRKQLRATRNVAQIGVLSTQLAYFQSAPSHDKDGQPIDKTAMRGVVEAILAARAKELEELDRLSADCC